MGNYQIGDNYTTLKSGVTGVIKEIHPQASGSVRILLDVQGNERWTTWSAKKANQTSPEQVNDKLLTTQTPKCKGTQICQGIKNQKPSQ